MTSSLHPRPPHLLLAISSHGFGHLSQAAPVINQLRKLIPDLRLTVRAAFSEAQIKTRIFNPDVLQPVADDFGMIMHDALTIDLAASLKAYQQFHHSMPAKVQRLSQELIEQKVDLVLSDIPYLTLAAAQHAGIPSIALCSLNWADILEYFLEKYRADISSMNNTADSLAETGANIVNEIRAIYQTADHFLLPTPSMQMKSLSNTLSIGPVCDPGSDFRATLISSTKLPRNSWLVLVGMGGMPYELQLNAWPSHMLGKPLYYIVADKVTQKSAQPNIITETSTGLTYSDLVATIDLIITKPGYGMFAEAAAAGVPVLFAERPDWPESKALTSWLNDVAHCAEISSDTLHRGDFFSKMHHLLQLGRYTPVPPAGNLQAANLLAQYLRSTNPACHG